MTDNQKQSLPYPDTDGIIKNPAFINDISAARQRELGDISDYIYLSLMLECYNPEAAKLFERMAMTEMNHFRILGRMLICLGGDPAIRSRHTNPFYGRPDKMDGHIVARILSGALEGERAAAVSYQKLAEAMSLDKCAAAILERIAIDEEHHARMLSRISGETC